MVCYYLSNYYLKAFPNYKPEYLDIRVLVTDSVYKSVVYLGHVLASF